MRFIVLAITSAGTPAAINDCRDTEYSAPNVPLTDFGVERWTAVAILWAASVNPIEGARALVSNPKLIE